MNCIDQHVLCCILYNPNPSSSCTLQQSGVADIWFVCIIVTLTLGCGAWIGFCGRAQKMNRNTKNVRRSSVELTMLLRHSHTLSRATIFSPIRKEEE